MNGFDDRVGRVGRFSLRDSPLAQDVLATHEPVIVTSHADRDARYPSMAGNGVRQQAWVDLP